MCDLPLVNSAEQSVRGRFKLSVELPCLFLLFAVALSAGVQSNLLLYRACTVDLGYNASTCDSLRLRNKTDEGKQLETQVQAQVTIISMVLSVISGILPAVLSVFLGSWSDKFGRKPLIVCPVVGLLLSGILSTVYSAWPTLGAWWFIVCSLPFAMLGGSTAFGLGSFLTLTDISDDTNRSFRLGIFQTCMFVGLILGIIASSYVNASFGYFYAFLFVTCIYFIILVYILTFVDESLETATQPEFWNIFDLDVLKDMTDTWNKPRPEYVRTTLIMLISALSITVFCVNGVQNMEYMFTREQFQWLLREYSIFCAINVIFIIFGLLFGIGFLQQVCKMSDGVLLILAYLSSVSDSAIKGLSVHPWQMFIGSSTSFLSGLTSPLTRSQVAKLVPESELGRVYALMSSVEAIMPVFSPTLYNLLYYKTLSTVPGAMYLVSAGFYAVCFVLALVAKILSNKILSNQYVALDGSINDQAENT